MPWTKEDRSFKTLVNRRTTSSAKSYYEEVGDNTINVGFAEIWTDDINSSPAQAVIDGVAEQHTLFTLTEDISVGSQQSYYAYESGNRLKDWISDKYGIGYVIHLYQNTGAEIFPTDLSQWFFDYQTGILTFNGSVSGFTKPFKISGYRYIGGKGSSGIPLATDSTAGRVYIAGNNVPIPLYQPTAIRTDDSRIWSWDPTGVHGITGDATIGGDATVVGTALVSRLIIDSMQFPTSDGGAGQIIKTDGSGSLAWYSGSSVLINKERYEVYDVTSSAPTAFYLGSVPVNTYAVRMTPIGGIELTNSIDFSVSDNTVTYGGSPSFESGDKILFKYTAI